MKFSLFFLGTTTLALASCGGGSNEQTGEGQSSSDWEFSQTVDELTDAKIDTAKGNLSAGDYGVEAEISCINGEIGRYQFTFTQTFGMPAPMNIRVGRAAFGGGCRFSSNVGFKGRWWARTVHYSVKPASR